MENVVVGEGSLDIRELANAMEKSKPFATLVKNWKEFGECLGVDDVELLDLERRLKIGDIQLKKIPSEIIKIWRADQGTNASLRVLHEALVHCGVKDIADVLFMQYWKSEQMQTIKFKWNEEVLTLEELLGKNIAPEANQKILDELKKCFPKQPIQLIRQEVTPPAQPKYYVPRTIFYIPSNELNEKLFTSKLAKENVFLFKGMRKHDIARLAGYQAVELSGRQLRHVNVSFIELECDQDFDRISNTTRKPVHMIEQKDGHYFWVKSSKNLELIRKFLKGEGNNMDEQEFASSITALNPPCSVSIADSPGMGKTSVLIKLANAIKESSSGNNINLYIVLHELIQHDLMSSCTCALESIAAYSTCNQVAKLVLLEMLTSHLYQLNVYLDGYDEVMQDKLDMTDLFLKQLQYLTNVKVIVTTRPHLQTRLELIFSQFAYQIMPFNDSNQIDCLLKFWIDQPGAKEGEILEAFAKQCLEALETTLTDKEKSIAGIPLQCMMLAEVYAEDAIRASNLDIIMENDVPPKAMSLFDMYKNLIELKFKRSPSQKYVDFHIQEAIALLFPGWLGTFKPLLNGMEEIDEDRLYAIGLLEKSPNRNAPRFVHRTFAEYLLAEFVVHNLDQQEECVNILFGEILGRKGSIIKSEFVQAIRRLPFAYSAIAYFTEMHLKEYSSHHVLDALLPKKYSRFLLKTKFHSEDVCVALRLCCEHDLEYTFDYAAKVLRKCWIRNPTRDLYFKGLPAVVLLYSSNVDMLEKVLDLTKSKFGVDLSYHNVQNEWLVGWILTSMYMKELTELGTKHTIIHLAVYLGKYNFFTYLVHRYGENVIKKLDHLLAVSVIGSAANRNSVIQDKLLIIDMLVKINPRWLEQKVINTGKSPLLQTDVHLSLLKRLVEHGADINACSTEGETVLHTAYNIEGYTDILRWALSNGFTRINQTNSLMQTPLMHAVRACETIDDELMTLFQEVGADFNAQDDDGESILFYALERSEDVEFIRRLLECGVNVNHENFKKQNAVHKVIYGKWNSQETLTVLKLLKSKGLKLQFNHRDLHGHTLLEVARSRKKVNAELLKFLKAEMSSKKNLA